MSLETYRKDGRAVRTTVWFVLDGDVLYCRTLRDAGKVRRLRENANVRMVPSSFGGEPMGSWVDARAEAVVEEDSVRIDELFKGKYGLQKRLTDLGMRMRGKRYVMYGFRLVGQSSQKSSAPENA